MIEINTAEPSLAIERLIRQLAATRRELNDIKARAEAGLTVETGNYATNVAARQMARDILGEDS